MAQSSPMNGGNGTYSYAKNSDLQRVAASAMSNAMKEAVIDNLEIKKLLHGSSSSSTRFAIADLGCSVGPNTFYAMQTLIEAVEEKYSQESDKLEFQVFFNDQMGNDFNTLFASLPQPRNYLAAAVPGSFNARLFPSSSIDIAYSSNSLQWLSKVPEGVKTRDSPAWNAGRIYYTGASEAVVNAYADQFEKDMEMFFAARAAEVAAGGLVVILMPAVPRRDVHHCGTVLYTFMQSIFLDMVKEGLLEKEKVDSFNIPTYFPCIEDMRSVVEANGNFKIVKMELQDFDGNTEVGTSIKMHIRAGFEGMIGNHFGNQIVDQYFEMAMQKKFDFTHALQSSDVFNGLLFAVLKRK